MHIEDLAKLVCCQVCTLRIYLCRAEFHDIKICRGVVTGVTPQHVARIKEIMKKRLLESKQWKAREK